MDKKRAPKDKRKSDPYLDRRVVEDRRRAYNLDYFSAGGAERRAGAERRREIERRRDCVKVSRWSSVCPKE